jgi:hypothetical protein
VKGKIVIFISHWRILPGNRDVAIARFAKTGGQPPQGVKMLGRWHDVANGTGVAISEASDSSAMARWALEWNDLMEMNINPALTDAELAVVLGELSKR